MKYPICWIAVVTAVLALAACELAFPRPTRVTALSLSPIFVTLPLGHEGIIDATVAPTDADSRAVRLLLGQGDGTFAPAAYLAVGSVPSDIAAGDFDGDDHLDLALSASQACEIFLANPDGTLQTARAIDLQLPYPLVAGDLTCDSFVDLALGDPSNHAVLVLQGAGDGSFTRVLYHSGGWSDDLLAVDASNDDRNEILVTIRDPSANCVNILIQR
jgi:hypothetical protein